MFQFRRFPTYAYLIQRRLTEYCSAGFPHSVILGSKDMCSSPRLIAACHDLHRLLMPRHSPCALCSLTSDVGLTYIWFSRIMQITEKFIFRLVVFTQLRVSTISLTNCLFCCLLFIFLLRCSVFKVRTLWLVKTRSKCLNCRSSTSIRP